MEDTLLIPIILVVIVIIFIFAYFMLTTGNDAYQAFAQNEAMAANIQTTTTNFPAFIDNFFLMLFIGAYLAVILLALRIDTDPAFFMVAVLFALVVGTILPFLANMFSDVTAAEPISSIIDEFTFIPVIMNFYLQMNLVMIFLVMIVLYARLRGGEP